MNMYHCLRCLKQCTYKSTLKEHFKRKRMCDLKALDLSYAQLFEILDKDPKRLMNPPTKEEIEKEREKVEKEKIIGDEEKEKEKVVEEKEKVVEEKEKENENAYDSYTICEGIYILKEHIQSLYDTYDETMKKIISFEEFKDGIILNLRPKILSPTLPLLKRAIMDLEKFVSQQHEANTKDSKDPKKISFDKYTLIIQKHEGIGDCTISFIEDDDMQLVNRSTLS